VVIIKQFKHGNFSTQNHKIIIKMVALVYPGHDCR